MTGEHQKEPVNFYRPWVGVFLSLIISGAAQFLTGKKLEGIAWFLAPLLFGLAGIWCLASPHVPGDFPAFVLLFFGVMSRVVVLVKSYQPVPKFGRIGLVLFIILVLIIGGAINEITLGIVRNCFRPFKIPTASMSPTLQGNRRLPDGTRVGGDKIFVEGCAYWFSKPQRGDIVAFDAKAISEEEREKFMIPPGEFYVKRIAGIPGDVLSIQNGHLHNHGQILSEPEGLAKLQFTVLKLWSPVYLSNPSNDYTVPDDSYFVVGDNTTNSLDSRYYGAVLGKNIIGKASKIYWPLQRVGKIQ
jgi:signal peptidase I